MILLAPADMNRPTGVSRMRAGIAPHADATLLALPLAGVYNGCRVVLSENDPDGHAEFLSSRLGARAEDLAYLATGLPVTTAQRALSRLRARVSRYDPRRTWEGDPGFMLADEASWQRFAVAATSSKSVDAIRGIAPYYQRLLDTDRATRARVNADRQASFQVVHDSTPRDVSARRASAFIASVRIGEPVRELPGEALAGGITQTHCDGLVHVEVSAPGPGLEAVAFSLAPCPTRGGVGHGCYAVCGADRVRWTASIYRALADHRVSRRASSSRFRTVAFGHTGYMMVSPELGRLYGGAIFGRFARLYAETGTFLRAMGAAGRAIAPSMSYLGGDETAELDTQIAVTKLALLQLKRERAAWRAK